MCLSFSCSSWKQFLSTVQGETSKASSFKQMARRWQSHKHPEKLKTRDPLITTEKTWVPGHHGNAVRDHSNSSAPWRNSFPFHVHPDLSFSPPHSCVYAKEAPEDPSQASNFCKHTNKYLCFARVSGA